MRRKTVTAIIIFLLLFNQTELITMQQASASMKNGDMVTLTHAGQVIDTITYNGKTVDAVYSNEAYPSSDTTYSCAAFVKKFYSTVYGIGVYNLNSSVSVPLVYENKGSFSLTDDPQTGDIVRDNTRTHWAIVKAVDGDTITVIQQSYRSGSMAWINCTIDRYDTNFSYFTYSSRAADTSKAGAAETTEAGAGTAELNSAAAGTIGTGAAELNGAAAAADIAAADTAASIESGTYYLIQASYAVFMNAADAEKNWSVRAAGYDGSSKQMLSIVNCGMNQYFLQFLSNQRFLSVSETKQMVTTQAPEQKFVFMLRENGLYTISLAEDLNKVVALVPNSSTGGYADLVLKDYTGAAEDFWYINLQSTATIPIVPQAAVSKKTLYTGYKNYSLKVDRLIMNSIVSYTSSDPGIAAVNSEGIVNPVGKGKAVILIRVIQDNQTYDLPVIITVKDPYIKITASSKEISVGKSITLKAKAYGSDSTVTWRVSDRTVAYIDSKSGRLSARKKGTVTVSARSKDGLSASIKLKVK